ncbi:hypothetical protein FALBO_7477 [Fusarium albosuccineum]|uniref:Uncharacterized protein n=1 Tax=Fusarium albosuccineum TaxID=1237068 RepID=A0A8H4LBC4_9HYPO|nr:hypothetical protein FALBO_7477 [Fusarium albosuccineum]
MDGVLNSLHKVVNDMKQESASTELAYSNAMPGLRAPLAERQLPPIERTASLARDLQTVWPAADSSGARAWIHELYLTEKSSSLCLVIYFSKSYSHAEFIITNAGLMYLFQDHAERVVEQRNESLSYAHMNRVNLETALANLPLNLPGDFNTIFALVLGVRGVYDSLHSVGWF